MNTKIILIFFSLFYSILYSQIGINNQNPFGVFHVDATNNNPIDGKIPSKFEQSDDFLISNTGVVGIGTINPSSYSSLEIESIKGLRLPQLTTDQRVILDALSSSTTIKKNGLTIYNITTKCIDYWALTEWIELCGTPMCIPVKGIPVISPSNPTLIVNNKTIFTVSEVENATSYDWYVNGSIQPNQTSSTFSYIPTSNASLSITVIAKGCNDSSTNESVAVTGTPCALVEGTPTITLTSGNLKVNTQATFTASNVNNATSYEWYVNGNIQNDQIGSTFTYTPTSTAPVTITVIAKGCNDSLTSPGTYTGTPCDPVVGTPTITLTSGSLKVNTQATFTASNVSNATSYEWYVNGNIQNDQIGSTFTYTPTSTAPVTITVRAKGCNDSLTSSSTYTGTPETDCNAMAGTLKLSRTVATANAGQTVKFTASGVANATRYVFTLNNKVVQDGASTVYSFFVNVEQNNTITVTAYDACGNIQEASTTLNSTNFVCKTTGRFLKPGTQCKTYYYCVTLTTKYEYDCPNYPTSQFNVGIRQCSTNIVKCPY